MVRLFMGASVNFSTKIHDALIMFDEGNVSMEKYEYEIGALTLDIIDSKDPVAKTTLKTMLIALNALHNTVSNKIQSKYQESNQLALDVINNKKSPKKMEEFKMYIFFLGKALN
jgi:hypothetical protein